MNDGIRSSADVGITLAGRIARAEAEIAGLERKHADRRARIAEHANDQLFDADELQSNLDVLRRFELALACARAVLAELQLLQTCGMPAELIQTQGVAGRTRSRP